MMEMNQKSMEEVNFALEQLDKQLQFMHVAYQKTLFKQKEDEYYNLLQSIMNEHVKMKKLQQRI